MKITFVLPCNDLSGGLRVAAIYAERLRKRGHDVCAVFPPDAPPTWRQRVRALLKGQGWLAEQPKEISHFDRADVSQYIASSSPIAEADVPDGDVVIATWWETAEWVAQLSEAKGVKVYFIQHHEMFDYLPAERVQATYTLPFHKITISKWLLELMQTEYGDRTVSVVPNSVDAKQFYASPRNKQRFPTVGLSYSSTTWKGCDIALKAFSIAAEKIPTLRLVAFGREDPLPELPLPTGTDYIQQPEQDKIKDVYAKCDAWLFSSRCEGFGLPVLEAMACRTPVIGTPAGAAPELLSEGGGLLVKPDDPEDMARAIEQICHLSDQEWQTMSIAAYSRAMSYTWDDATQQFEVALRLAIARQQQGDFSAAGSPKASLI